MNVPVFVNWDAPSTFDISAEEANSGEWVNYHEGYRIEGWSFGVHPDVDAVLHEHGLHAEWLNPGHLRIYD